MQEKNNQALRETAKADQETVEKVMDKIQPSEKQLKKLHIPAFWKKRKINPNFIKELEESINSEPIATDGHGEYRVGKFLHSCAVVVVSHVNDLWSVEIHNQHTIGLPMIQEVRYKFLPDNLMMAQLFLPREQRNSENVAVLYQIPGELRDNSSETTDEETAK